MDPLKNIPRHRITPTEIKNILTSPRNPIVLVTIQYCFLHVFRNNYQAIALTGRPCIINRLFFPWSPKFVEHNYVTVTESLTGLILQISQSTIFVLFMLILELSLPSTVFFPYPRVTGLKKEVFKQCLKKTAFHKYKLFFHIDIILSWRLIQNTFIVQLNQFINKMSLIFII